MGRVHGWTGQTLHVDTVLMAEFFWVATGFEIWATTSRDDGANQDVGVKDNAHHGSSQA